MSQALTFNNVTLAPIPHQNSLWIRSVELARALGYSDESSVGRIYKRNAEEFTPEMTQVIEISDTVNLTVPARIFSLRGCHLVAMFARTPVAKAFRRWVLDVLDKLDAEQRAASPSPTPDGFTGPLSLTPSSVADRRPLRALVGSWAQVSGLPFAACWNQLKAAFNLANIKELPQEWIPDAIAWVQKRIDALPKALPPQPEHLPLYRDGAFYLPPANNPAHKPGPKEWGSRTRELEQLFNSLSRDLDACRGKTFAYAISDLGRHADTAFSTDAMLEGLYASQDTARDLFRQALHSMSRQLLLSLNVAVAMGR